MARAVAEGSVDMPGGNVRIESGEMLVRTIERREHGQEFRDLIVRTGSDGARVILGDIAHICETDEAAFFKQQPAVQLRVYRVGDQTPVGVADVVKRHVSFFVRHRDRP